ncbi:uncharacterized protein LOC113006033 [Solenopsis invicta]|uniref:uncharacterized protein LOC113006033 n=1 Tax=Solenopsis invicta TaxID=13686 RepID=UPI000E33ECAF|nr:uncharacterized protein LOC113006033 [Solenopsis invicta]
MENTSTAEKESTDIDDKQDLSNEPGCRIVDLKFLDEQLWCTSCKETLSLKNIKQEERRGLGSVLFIRCHKCLFVNPVVTGKQHIPPGKSRRNSRFDGNTKLAIGLIHSGIGFTNLNKLLACLNIPPINFKTYKRYEAEAGGALEIAAKESCQHAVELERQLTLENKATVEINI